MMRPSEDITRRLDGILFGFYSPEEIRKMSVVEITCLSAFDQVGSPISQGLYDPKMGVSPYERHGRCVTCGQGEEACPGHIGHIELEVPVCNVFLVSYLHKLLRAKCLFCHKLKITASRQKHYRIMFTLLKFGLLAEYEAYRKLCEIRVPNKYRPGAKVETSTTKSGKKDVDSVRKASNSTRKPSDTSESAPSDKNTKKELEDKERAAMSQIYCNLEASADLQRAEIEALLDVKANADRYRNGFDWNTTLNQKFT